MHLKAQASKELQFEKCLGRGYFGEVWRAKVKKNGQLVAVKKADER